MGVLPFLQPILISASIPIGAWLGGAGTFLGVAIAFFLHPVFDTLLGRAPSGVPTARPGQGGFDLPIHLYPFLQAALLVFALTHFTSNPLTLVEKAGILLSTGVVTGAIGITVAHELIHRPRAWERGLGVFLLQQVSYAHFRLAHVYWHHRHVATELDPASARFGETVYGFWWRSIAGNLKAAWTVEKQRSEQRGGSPWSAGNRMLYYGALEGITALAIAWLWGALGLGFFLIQSLIAILLLETINYIEHYGLRRRRQEEGYEPVRVTHSWDCEYRLTNWYLFNLGRHARHHTQASLPYERLAIETGSGKLPAGYSTMILASLVPPLFHRLMNARALTRNAGQ